MNSFAVSSAPGMTGSDRSPTPSPSKYHPDARRSNPDAQESPSSTPDVTVSTTGCPASTTLAATAVPSVGTNSLRTEKFTALPLTCEEPP